MMIFTVVAALLLAAALLFVIPPLLQRRRADTLARSAVNITVYRDQLAELERDLENDIISREQYELGRRELERRLLEDVDANEAGVRSSSVMAARKSAIVVGVLLPLFAVGGYFYLGNPQALDPQEAVREQISQMSESEIADQINAMVAQLARRLENDPTDAEGWKMLGRSYIALQRFDDALAAFDNAVRLDANDAQLLADYADALAMAGGESLEGRPLALIRRALEIDPANQKALWLAGTAAYERADFEEALQYWRRLYEVVPKDSPAARTMESNIAEAEALLAGRAPAAGAAATADAATSVGGEAGEGLQQVNGVVSLDPSLLDRVEGEDTVYVFARAPEGPRMPLAIIRAQVKDLPLDFTLDDSQAINPAMSLSRFPRVEVVARISRSGDAIPRSGDLQGSAGVVGAGETARVVIDEVVP